MACRRPIFFFFERTRRAWFGRRGSFLGFQSLQPLGADVHHLASYSFGENIVGNLVIARRQRCSQVKEVSEVGAVIIISPNEKPALCGVYRNVKIGSSLGFRSHRQRKCRPGALPAAIEGIPDNICSSRAFVSFRA